MNKTAHLISGLCLLGGCITNLHAQTFIVSALENPAVNNLALDTEIRLIKGQRLTVSATGEWNTGIAGVGFTDANGTEEHLWGGMPRGSLLGSVGNTSILLGTSWSGPAPDSNKLYLAFCDKDTWGNEGEVTVSVSVGPAPKGKPECDVTGGNPIHTGMGYKYQEEIDYLSADGFSFARHYNSEAPGNGWQFGWQSRIVFDGEYASVFREDGREHEFLLVKRQWRKLTHTNDNLVSLTNANGQITGWEYRREDHSIETYDADGKLNTITDNNGNVTSFAYSDGSALYLTKDTNTALPAGLLINVTSPSYRTLNFAYDSKGQIVEMQDPAGQLYHYRYLDTGQLVEVTYPDQTSREYFYEDLRHPFALTGIRDENGNRYATWTYDEQGRAISSEHGSGIDKVSLQFNNDNTTTITDALGSVYTQHFASVYGVLKNAGLDQPSGSGCAASTSHKTYDYNGNVTSETDFNGHTTCYAYNLNRNLEKVRVEGVAPGKACPSNLTSYTPEANTPERKISTLWHSTYRIPTKIAEPQRISTMSYDAKGNLKSVAFQATLDTNGGLGFTAPPIGDVLQTQMAYTLRGQLESVDGPRNDVNDVVQYTYSDDQGDLRRIEYGLGHSVLLSNYDSHGRAGMMVNPNGLTTSFNYNNRGRLVSSVTETETTTYEYDNVGNLIRVNAPDGTYVRYDYDIAHRLVAITDVYGNQLRYTLDNMGNRTETAIYNTDGEIVQQHFQVFDDLGRLWKDIGTLNQTTTYEYDAVGNLTKVISPLEHSSTYQYDTLNRLINHTNALQGVTDLAYNGQDELIQVIDPKRLVTQYQKNGLGQLETQSSPDSGDTQYTYNIAGNVETATDAKGQTRQYSYDELNRVTEIRYVDNSRVTYHYDAYVPTGADSNFGKGRVTKIMEIAADGQLQGQIEYRYDQRGRMVEDTRLIDGTYYVTGYAYGTHANRPDMLGAIGKLIEITYPTGQVVTYDYNPQGQVSQITTRDINRTEATVVASNIQYHPLSHQVKSFTYGNGTQYVKEMNLDGLIESYTLGGNELYQVNYDAANRVSGIDQVLPLSQTGNAIADYGYDALGRLTAIDPKDPLGNVYRYAYDANGNRILRTHFIDNVIQGMLEALTEPASNRVTQLNSVTQQYDDNGNLLDNGEVQRTYNVRNRLQQITTSRGFVYNYVTNALGQRVQKASSEGDRVRFHYHKTGQLLAETSISSSNSIERKEYIWLGDIPVAVLIFEQQGKSLFYVHSDHQNTPRMLTDENLNVRWRWDLDEGFGDSQPIEQPTQGMTGIRFNLRFAGQYYDRETQTSYNYFRDYDAKTGRYTTSDPIGLAGGINTYAYVGGNPLNLTDPYGLAPVGRENNDWASIKQEWAGEKTFCGAMLDILNREGDHPLINGSRFKRSMLASEPEATNSMPELEDDSTFWDSKSGQPLDTQYTIVGWSMAKTRSADYATTMSAAYKVKQILKLNRGYFEPSNIVPNDNALHLGIGWAANFKDLKSAVRKYCECEPTYRLPEHKPWDWFKSLPPYDSPKFLGIPIFFM